MSTRVPSPDDLIVLFPLGDESLLPGLNTSFCRAGKHKEVLELQESGVSRVWTVRAVVAQAVPLAGLVDWVSTLPGNSNFRLSEDPLTIYLHYGGHTAVYFDLRANRSGHLQFIDVQVESELPANAVLLAQKPINALLDVLTRDSSFPILVQRLELLSPSDGSVLVTEFLLPADREIQLGPLGGILQATPFAPYDAVFREGVSSSSPYYRLLCAAKLYEGTGSIRKWLKKECERRRVTATLPKMPRIDRDQVFGMGLPAELLPDGDNVQSLYEKLVPLRNGIAHFLVKNDGVRDGHVYLADGIHRRTYSAAAASLLYYAHIMLDELRIFYVQHLPRQGSQILPMPQYRDKFVVRAKDQGLK